MTIAETNLIDIVASRPDSDIVKLVIADHLEWGDDLQGHFELLQGKVNTYLEFVESGQIHELEGQPIPAKPEIWIVLAAENAPSSEAMEFLSRLEQALAEFGVRFELRIG